jgi:hypothetical protein
MKNTTIPVFVTALCLVACAALLISFKQSTAPVKPVAAEKCIIISDIHFSPIYASTEKDTVLKRKLEHSTYEEWIKYFEGTPAQMELDSTLMFKDSNYALLRSAMANMKRKLPHPAFIVIAGDFIWHGAIPADSVLKKRTLQFISRLFKEYFPGTLIIPTMGNNDTYGADYALQNPKFLKDFADVWMPNLPSNSADSLKKHGYYTCEDGNMRFVVLNSALLNAGTKYPEGAVMLKWLKNTLENTNGKNTWIVMHIPPGMNSYNETDFWNKPFVKEFTGDLIKYGSNVRLTIASHTHFDDFKVAYDESPERKPVSLVRIVPSICSNHGNYPSFDVVEVSKASGKIENEVNWYLNLSKKYTGKRPEQVFWADSINLKQRLHLRDLSPASFSQFINDIKANPNGQPLKDYAFVTSVGAPTGAVLLNKKSYAKYLKADSLVN